MSPPWCDVSVSLRSFFKNFLEVKRGQERREREREMSIQEPQSPTGSRNDLSVNESKNCLLAIPKKGRLYKKCVEILHGIGLEFQRPNRLVRRCSSQPNANQQRI